MSLTTTATALGVWTVEFSGRYDMSNGLGAQELLWRWPARAGWLPSGSAL